MNCGANVSICLVMYKVKIELMNTYTCHFHTIYMLRIHYLDHMSTRYFMSSFMFISFFHYVASFTEVKDE